MTAEELARYDGRNGQPAYVAVSGIIYDVSASPMWQAGNHMDQHQAGQDLTESLKNAPHVRKVVENFPTLGRLEEAAKTPMASSGKPVVLVFVLLIAVLIGWLLLR